MIASFDALLPALIAPVLRIFVFSSFALASAKDEKQ
jgi:hypothetical protein